MSGDIAHTTCDLFEHDESRLGSAQNLKLKLQISYFQRNFLRIPEESQKPFPDYGV
jgi:hypothetical protein